MAKESDKQIMSFLAPYPEHIRDLALRLRDFIRDLYPKSNELIYDNYNALVFGYSTTDKAGDAYCSIALYSRHLNFGFLRGRELSDPKKILKGKGSLYRYITMQTDEDMPVNYIKKILKASYLNSLSHLKDKKNLPSGTTTVKIIAGKKRRPGTTN